MYTHHFCIGEVAVSISPVLCSISICRPYDDYFTSKQKTNLLLFYRQVAYIVDLIDFNDGIGLQVNVHAVT